MRNTLNKVRVLNLKITRGKYDSVLAEIVAAAKENDSSYVCVSNVHMNIEAYWDPSFAEKVNGSFITTPDGLPIAKAIRMLYGFKQDRIAGMDLLPSLLSEAEKNNLSIFFYGGTQDMLDATKNYVHINYPRIEAHNYFSPPFRELNSLEEKEIIDRINEANPNLIFVALGCPKQEKWMASMKRRVNACMIGIGGALPVMIGMQKRAPMWMQKLSLEWLYRLLQEPRRLFKRYLITNTLFIFLLLKQLFLLRIMGRAK